MESVVIYINDRTQERQPLLVSDSIENLAKQTGLFLLLHPMGSNYPLALNPQTIVSIQTKAEYEAQRKEYLGQIKASDSNIFDGHKDQVTL